MFLQAGALLADVKVMPSRDDACIMEAPVSKTQFVHDLKEGDEVDSLFSVKFKKPPKAYTKGFMFEVRLADRSGEMTAKYWGPKDEAAVRKLYQSFDSDDVVRVQGFASSYRDALEIGISHDKKGRIERVPKGCFEISDFVARASRDVELMMSQLLAQVRKVQNQHLQALLAQFFSDEEFLSRFKSAPASMWMHCNWVGGLVEHTLNVVQICEFLARQYPKLDRDLLLTGAILHDVGKVEEYEVTTNIDVSEDGMLRGHIIIGAEMVSRACEKVEGMPKNLRLKVVHLVLASHGQPEFGSPKKPQFPEAVAVHFADDADAKLEQFIAAKEGADTEDPWVYNKRLGHIYLH
ncbi:MAG: HD domain-containing protein [Methanomassiliicoccales archaeon]|nr:HD domain-containing protein [Methanomassiliicoccales archaeon]